MSSSGAWWTVEPRSELSQGDIFTDIPIVFAPRPIQYVKPQTFPKSVKGWIVSDKPFNDSAGRTVLFAVGYVSLAIAISHDCEFDDQQGTKSILCARVEPIASAPPEHQPLIEQQQNVPRMFLPQIPSVGNCYVNLRAVATIDRKVIAEATRLASMTDEARALLQARLVMFFLRRVPNPR